MLIIVTIIAVLFLLIVCYSVYNKKKAKRQKSYTDKKESESVNASATVENAGSDGQLEFNESGANLFDEDFDVENYNSDFSEKIVQNNSALRHKKLSEIFADYDDYDEDEFAFEKVENKNSGEVLQEINKMSPKMKAILLTGALERKDF